MGGKQALFPTIIKRFPTGYQNMMYVEVFGGGGSVLLNKERSVREVLNDANGYGNQKREHRHRVR